MKVEGAQDLEFLAVRKGFVFRPLLLFITQIKMQQLQILLAELGSVRVESFMLLLVRATDINDCVGIGCRIKGDAGQVGIVAGSKGSATTKLSTVILM